MTHTRTRTVPDGQTRQQVIDEYARDGYTVAEEGDTTTLRYRDHGSLLSHAVLFFTVGWLTLGLLNLVYAWYRRRITTDRVEVRIDEQNV